MIGQLPTSLEVGGRSYDIRSDFRVVLNIFQAFNDPELTDTEKSIVCLCCLYKDLKNIPGEHMQEASEKATWFLNGGDTPMSSAGNAKIFDWEQDEKMLFSAVNKVAGYETRSVRYLHWWTFLGLFGEIGEGLFSQVMSIRRKKAKGKKLAKWEQEFAREHKDLITLHDKISDEEKQADEEFLRTII